ncbi:hypothetical protein K523DRAFT_281767 [Schizophyllum commune Tattone D]|nr:hypothetical protein K523DRAFT_281767 [Schizophyllum commune Tattone D]
MSVALLMIESASCYTAIVIVSQITYATGHVSNYFFTDCIPSVAALAAVLVHARAVLGKAVKIDSVAGHWGLGAQFNTELVRTRALATDGLGRGERAGRPRANLTPSLASFEAGEEPSQSTVPV